MRHGNYNTSHRHRNPTHPRRHHDPQPRPRNRNRNLPLPRPLPRPNQLNELELQLNRLELHVPPSPPAEAVFPREIEENTEELESRNRPREAQLRLGCDLCGGIPIINFDDFYRLTLEAPCPFICICHQVTIDSDDDGDGDESDDDENDDDESDDEDEDQLLITREIIREYLQNRDYSVIKLGKEEEEGEGEICVVCFNEMEGKEVFKRLDCGHNYHEECITKWLLCKNSCPMCVSTVIPPNFYAGYEIRSQR